MPHPKTLEEYLAANLERGIIDHSVRAYRGAGGKLEFYLHPTGQDGDTPTFVVEGNRLSLPDGQG